jgi:hypothetical protein
MYPDIMKKIMLLPVLLLSMHSLACSCEYAGSFLKIVPETKLVALVKITKFLSFKDMDGANVPMSMEVEIIQKYKGVELRKKVIVWGDQGMLCRPYLSVFKESEYYVVALHPGLTKGGHEKETANDFSISNCGAYWLSVDMKTSLASGDVKNTNKTIENISLKKLQSALNKNGRCFKKENLRHE